MGFQDLIWISRSHMDFKISMRFHRISLGFCKISFMNFSTVMIVIMDDSWEVVTKMY